jgi:hypothetical protein
MPNFGQTTMITEMAQIQILVSALAASVNLSNRSQAVAVLSKFPEAVTIAQAFGSSALARELRLNRQPDVDISWLTIEQDKNQILYQGQSIGKIEILYKSPLPGELQAKLAIESAIDRYLEYIQKKYQIVVLDESDRHVSVFIPNQSATDFATLWKEFLEQVAFSAYGKSEFCLPGLVQTFIVMLNAVTLSGRGFSTLDVPILTRAQANVLGGWYYKVIQDVKERQSKRQRVIGQLTQEINQINQKLEQVDLLEKDRKAEEKNLKTKEKELQDKLVMQEKEATKYQDFFKKSFVKSLEFQNESYQELTFLETQLAKPGLTKVEQKKLLKQQEKFRTGIIFTKEFVQQKLELSRHCKDSPFEFVHLDQQKHPENFRDIAAIAKNFDKRATDQINSTRGDIFTQCMTEMYRLLEMKPEEFDPLPDSLLTEQPIFPKLRSPGDDSKEFCYACGVALDPKTAHWQVLRFMFERPSQRRQSSSGEGRPHICSSCSALAFASPLKVTEESVILRLDPAEHNTTSELKIKDYLRMLTNKEMHLSSGRYLVLASERTGGGDLASQKLGQVQYALAKVSSIFPSEVLTDFKFSLIIQGSQITLLSRQLLFIKGLMDCYRQPIVISGKDINMALGDAVRYIQQDLPFLAEYTLTKNSSFSSDLKLEQIRELYWKVLQQDLQQQGDSMDSDKDWPKRAKLYRDVAALTGLTYAFVQSLENTAKKSEEQKKDPKYTEREVSKIIEKVDDPVAFNYYATLGDGSKTDVRARLFSSPNNSFIYSQTQWLLEQIDIRDRDDKDDKGTPFLQLYADDISRAYRHFAVLEDYKQEKDWKELTYNLKLSLYTRFPELVRKLKSTSENK